MRVMALEKHRRAAETAVREAGRVLLRAFDRLERSAVRAKARHGLVTDADRAAERVLFGSLTRAFPADGILAEEGHRRVTRSGYTWVIDPLDGTQNFVSHVPVYAVSVALIVNGTPVLGVVGSPATQELFTAITGCGAVRNGRAIHVSRTRDFRQAIVSVSAGYGRRTRPTADEVRPRLTRRVLALRHSGAVALDLVAVGSGGIDAAVKNGPVHLWDVLAGALIAREAGGTVSELSGQPFTLGSRDLVASNGLLHRPLLALLRH